VTLIVDAAPIVAMSDPDEPSRSAILDALRGESGTLAMPAPVTAEIDYLLGRRFGCPARSAFLRDLTMSRFAVACLEHEDYKTVEALDRQYADLDLGLADCAIVVLAERFQTNRIVSFDERHFRAVAPLQGGAFEILPADG
jgi:predicted nucleic acid-binding protein